MLCQKERFSKKTSILQMHPRKEKRASWTCTLSYAVPSGSVPAVHYVMYSRNRVANLAL